jgi:3-oxoacyl-[acyl-carrier-protein] synthase-1
LNLRATIEQVGAICPVGIGVEQIWSSVRAGISRFQESSVHDRWFEPIRMALLPEDALGPLLPPVDALPLTSRRRRMLRLAAPALRQVLRNFDGPPPPMMIGLPLGAADASETIDMEFVRALAVQSAVPFDETTSKTFARGRAAALLALDAALRMLAERRAAYVVVGAVDTYLDLALLGELGVEGRILGPRVMDGFIPGEGAAFLLLRSQSTRREKVRPEVAIASVGTARDQGHRYSDHPALGEGLSAAIERMLAGLGPSTMAVQTTFAGFNGEHFGAKEWGVARLRHARIFAQKMALEHPGDCFGDTGAAMGALLLAIAQTSLANGQRSGPALVWASSDREDCGCAYLEVKT